MGQCPFHVNPMLKTHQGPQSHMSSSRGLMKPKIWNYIIPYWRCPKTTTIFQYTRTFETHAKGLWFTSRFGGPWIQRHVAVRAKDGCWYLHFFPLLPHENTTVEVFHSSSFPEGERCKAIFTEDVIKTFEELPWCSPLYLYFYTNNTVYRECCMTSNTQFCCPVQLPHICGFRVCLCRQ